MASGVRKADGQFDFSAGVDSSRVPTVRSDLTPNGLRREQVSWLKNGVCRNGSLTPRGGWLKRCRVVNTGLFQSGWLYDQSMLAGGGDPYLVLSISGQIYRVNVNTDNTVVDLSSVFGLTNPAGALHGYMCQGEEFLVIQAGDYATLPLFWDGTTMRRAVAGELPAAGPMDYYMGRMWYALGRLYGAGDVVYGAAGTAPYNQRDSILKSTECALIIGGDFFSVPSNAGNITALAHPANLDAAMGQGLLHVFTPKSIYALSVPVDRSDWIGTTNNKQPLQTVVQRTNGSFGDRCVVSQNGDLFYQGFDGIRSLITALRYFGQWANVPISNNEQRAIHFNDPTLMSFSSGIVFDNRLLQTCLPYVSPAGVAFKGILPLDFDPISTLQDQLPPAWDGMWEGLNVLQLFVGNYSGQERAFAVVAAENGGIDVWELTTANRFDQDDKRIPWYFETPAWTWAQEFELKKLDGGEIWVDRVYGTVDFEFHYRTDSNPCWQFWHKAQVCAARTTCEDVDNPICYPEQPYREGYKFPIVLPAPPHPGCDQFNNRPMNIGFQFQIRVAVKGFCRVRSGLFYAMPYDRAPFDGLQG